MADIRIKDLTTEVSSTATGDFFVIDGTTGTRKTPAFNPTFGGNATVTGTLTVNSTFASSGSGTTLTSQFANTLTGAANILNLQLRRGDSANGFSRLMWGTGATTEWSLGSRSGDTNLYFWDEVANAERLKIASSTGNVSIASTSASTTTSTGALVVGNGTSGGLGVGGAINAGSYLRSINSAAANDTEFTALRADVGADGTLGAAVVAIGSLPSATGASRYGFITCSDNVDWRKLYIGGRPGLAASGGQVLIPSTASSTSTSSGALVVSGGVGVAGAVNAGTFYGLVDGVTAPATESGYARIYVDSADGDLKVKFGDGTVKTIATDS